MYTQVAINGGIPLPNSTPLLSSSYMYLDNSASEWSSVMTVSILHVLLQLLQRWASIRVKSEQKTDER